MKKNRILKDIKLKQLSEFTKHVISKVFIKQHFN